MTASKIMSLSSAKSSFARGVKIAIKGPQEGLGPSLQSTFAPYQDGNATVYVEYRNERARASLELGSDFTVKPCEELVAALNELDSVSAARLIY
jgi:DNA polymerase-3 subunit alpha